MQLKLLSNCRAAHISFKHISSTVNIISPQHQSPRGFALIALLVCGVVLEGCLPSAPRFRTPETATAPSATAAPRTAAMLPPSVDDRAVAVSEGMASYYADEFNGRKTSSGEVFDMNKLTCAHRTFEFGTRLRVVNLDNGRSCEVVVNDRGPFVADRIIDLSYAAAREIGMIGAGTARVRLEVLSMGLKK